MLENKNSNIASILRANQPFQNSKNSILSKLFTLVNQKKHNQLTPQTREEIKTLKMQFPGGALIEIGEGAAISGFGQITSGGVVIDLQGQTISPNNPARNVYGPLKQEVTTWVSFTLDAIKEPALPFLEQSLVIIDKIYQDLKPYLFDENQGSKKEG